MRARRGGGARVSAGPPPLSEKFNKSVCYKGGGIYATFSLSGGLFAMFLLSRGPFHRWRPLRLFPSI